MCYKIFVAFLSRYWCILGLLERLNTQLAPVLNVDWSVLACAMNLCRDNVIQVSNISFKAELLIDASNSMVKRLA